MKNHYAKQNPEELKKALSEKQAAWRVFRFNTAGSKITNVKEARGLRKEIARILTTLHEH